MSKSIKSFFVATMLYLIALNAHAVSLTWNIQNGIFEDGSLLTGSFDYDATLNSFSNINITTGSFGDFGENYTTSPLWVVSGSATQLQISKIAEPLDLLFLSFGAPLTNAGGTVPIAGVIPFEQINFFGVQQRELVFGSVSAVPVPAAVWLFGSAIGLLGWRIKRRA